MTNAPPFLLEAFEQLRAPRARECVDQLDELQLAAICSVISGADSWTTAECDSPGFSMKQRERFDAGAGPDSRQE